MDHVDEFNCVYCEKRYKHRGWLAKHIQNKHNDDFLLEKDMTVMYEIALELSTDEAGQNLSDDPVWEDNEPETSPGPTSTPRIANTVPLCPTASNYIIETRKTLPASFLTTLLPAPGFLENINKSLNEESNKTPPLIRFEEEIRHFKCEVCQLKLVGNVNLKSHMEKNHQSYLQPSRPDKAVGNLGDYLISLENKIENCTKVISEQSAMLTKILALHEVKAKEVNTAKHATSKNIEIIEIEDDLTIRHTMTCDECPFETYNKSQLNLHKSGAHSYTTNPTKGPVECPMCSFNNSSETNVRKHIEDKHPETFACNKCSQGFTTKNKLDHHTREAHTVASGHICMTCEKEFTHKDELTKHISDKHTNND